MKARYKILILNFLLIFIFSSILRSESFYWGKDRKWKDNVILTNIEEVYIPYRGYALRPISALQIKTNYLDLYLSFDSRKLYDVMNNYSIKYYNYKISDRIKNIGKSANVIKPDSYIIVNVSKYNFLANDIDLGSFTINFWIYPVLVSEGAILVKKGVFYNDKFYGIIIKIEHKKVKVYFKNFFYDSNENRYSFTLESSSYLELKKWYNINIAFNKFTGEILFSINNNKKDIKYATVTGAPYSEILIPHFSKVDGSDLILFKDFYGFVDDFKIVKKFTFEYSKINRGTIISKIIDLKEYNSKIKEVNFEFINLLKGDIKLKVRYGNRYFSLKKWISPFYKISNNHIILSEIPAVRFFQWRLDINRVEGISSALLKFYINYFKNIPPLPPKNVYVDIYNGFIRLRWNKSVDSSIKGYIIYWGERSKNYENKLDIGFRNSYIFKNLEKEKRYYFVITSYNSKKPYTESKFSKEVSIFFK